MSSKAYTKSLQDELDWKLLDQLYGVVAQISGFCFETKKFCVTTEFVVLTFMVKFTTNKLDHSIFVGALILPLCFWFLDATGYFYQVKLRGTMEAIRNRLNERDGGGLLSAGGAQIISPSRTELPIWRRVVDAAFNHSMWLYFVLVVADLVVWSTYILGVIR